jgi:pyruvate, water dikinase
MTDHPADKLLADLQERAKELNCLYEVEELLNRADLDLEHVFERVVKVIPPGWQYPDCCETELTFEGRTYRSSEFTPTRWLLRADLIVQRRTVGALRVYYTEWQPSEDKGPFLKEEGRLVRTIAERLSHYIFYQQLKDVRTVMEEASETLESRRPYEWRAPVELLRRTDRDLYLRIARKMLNHLYRAGVEEAGEHLRRAGERSLDAEGANGEVNAPGRRPEFDESWMLTDGPFVLAAQSISDEEILTRIQHWMVEDRANYFTKMLHNERSSLPEIADALRRYHHVVADVGELPAHRVAGLRVALIQRLLTEQLDFIKVAKSYVGTHTFEKILERVVMPAESYGKLGGKAAGLILAHRMLRKHEVPEDGRPVRVPLTWFVASSGMRQFIAYNDLEDVLEQKYKPIDEARHDYPNIVRLFKNSRFPPELVKGISLAMAEFEERPLVVRSSSLLEDRVGAAFSGKYKSLFLANQGSKAERLEALLDAIAEVYASTFGPDPIEYRREHGLLDFNEEMGILIQEVVGSHVGRYFLPAFAGVAFSNNEFRWSPRIQREDGLLRLVPGLGSRAVDRVADDYPILVVPKKPQLRVNASADEVVRYSPRWVDLIDLAERRFCTVEVKELLATCGTELPAFEQLFSVLDGDMLRRPSVLMTDPAVDELVVTFDGLIQGTPFVARMAAILDLLQEKLGRPVDIEFAHDGEDLYLLQCRVQSNADDEAPAAIPRDVPRRDLLFAAHRHVSNGWIPDLTHLVYVDPERYGELGSRNEMLEVGRTVGKLNKLLPRRRFALLGPGRWGSRGDIKLGVSVTYADINNTALLVEIARQKGGYVPDLSFGTHFFQDLVEARIRYLPLYPDEPDEVFREAFFRHSPNVLAEMLPDFAHLSPVVKVIDVPASADGRLLRVLMNADLDEAVALLVESDEADNAPRHSGASHGRPSTPPAEHWRWRLQMAQQIGLELDPEHFGVVALYVLGSTKNATAGPGSDIDLLIHLKSDEAQRERLETWLDGWSRALAQMNYMRTGYRSEGLLDLHFVTDGDIADRTSWAIKIGAITDAARPLPLGGAPVG